MKTKLSASAASILANVIAAMQNAEELGGVDDNDDYIKLMQEISSEAESRRCLVQYAGKQVS